LRLYVSIKEFQHFISAVAFPWKLFEQGFKDALSETSSIVG